MGVVGALHIPDGFLDPPVIVVTYVASSLYALLAFRRLGGLGGERLFAASVLAAGIFAAQMISWPVPGGTSLHFLGGALAGILFGPFAGFYSMLLVLVVQALLFRDGGLTSLGANVLNMAVIDVVVGYYVFRVVAGLGGYSRASRLAGAFLGGWLGFTLAGVAAGLEIGVSASFPYGVSVSVPVMAFWHALLGVVEGAATALVVDYLARRGAVAWGWSV